MSCILIKTEKETIQLAKEFAACCPKNKRIIIFLNGELGAGKTFFVRALVKSLGYPGLVKSPTYTLMETYELAGYCIYHLDLYRLQSANEILDMGLCDEFEHAAIWLIEWPERALNFLPKPDIVCHIDLISTNRQFQFFAKTPQGEQALALFNRI
ncbi:tRNA (adenosine(37)-N6)-threonylcarbamoyltransferase complex ATPase subunit type 1 TsaE [Rickettsiella endosymbiont of Miltochrista miniata]|uniref:tRNA (adenosine(37)-N6)-threonylcarbamoyltransferase complex ATPase subunit type 1 TsaE n=1 Tax=Rickettsiella endosymbiont of Miltochrista miniata TaxID=3066239 RepID=UPI00313C585B